MFKSYRSYRDFAKSVKWASRFIRTPEDNEFLDNVLQTAKSRHEVVPKGQIIWRAQVGNAWRRDETQDAEFPEPYDRDRMKPRKDLAEEGRANPKGIPYLYAATHEKTAVSEVRPALGAYVSVAQFHPLRNLRVVELTTSTPNRIRIYEEGVEPEASIREDCVWHDIDSAFSEPIQRSDEAADYVPSQIIAELFKANGFDGIAYRSGMGPGHNFALFEPSLVELYMCGLVTVKSVNTEYEESANPYFIV